MEANSRRATAEMTYVMINERSELTIITESFAGVTEQSPSFDFQPQCVRQFRPQIRETATV